MSVTDDRSPEVDGGGGSPAVWTCLTPLSCALSNAGDGRLRHVYLTTINTKFKNRKRAFWADENVLSLTVTVEETRSRVSVKMH